ncbi:MAG TPA: PIN domain-containing protein [Chitinophagaceae bacterium]|nr:PIN domain-containing protein [Chitinophagaceae bacterium]
MKNGVNLVIDSNILIYWLLGDTYAAEILSENFISYSIITEIEVKGHISLISDQQKIKLQKVLNRFHKISLTEEIKELAVEYKIKYNLKTPDAIIASTARFLKFPLVTADRKVIKVENIVTVLFSPEK